mgnify:CR=1 FL=1
MSTELEIKDVKMLQPILKQLMAALKKFSDSDLLDKYAKQKGEEKERKQAEKKKMEREKLKSKYKLTKNEIELYIDNAFQSMDDMFDEEQYEYFPKSYSMVDYIKDVSPVSITDCQNRCQQLKQEIKDKLSQLIPKE